MNIFQNEAILSNVILHTEYEELVKMNNRENDHPFRGFLNLKYVIKLLCEKYDIKVVDSFSLFSKKFLKKYFFTHHVSEVTRKNKYKTTYLSVASCLSKACDSSNWEFVRHLFGAEKLYKSNYHLRLLAIKCYDDYERFERIVQIERFKNISVSNYDEGVLRECFKNNLSDEKVRWYFDNCKLDLDSFDFTIVTLVLGYGRWNLVDYLIESGQVEPRIYASILESIISCDNIDLFKSRDVPQHVIDKIYPDGLEELSRQDTIRFSCEHGSIKILDYIEATCEEVEAHLKYISVSSICLWYLKHGVDFSNIPKTCYECFDLEMVKYLHKNNLMPKEFVVVTADPDLNSFELVKYIHNKVDTNLKIGLPPGSMYVDKVCNNIEFRRFHKRLIFSDM